MVYYSRILITVTKIRTYFLTIKHQTLFFSAIQSWANVKKHFEDQLSNAGCEKLMVFTFSQTLNAYKDDFDIEFLCNLNFTYYTYHTIFQSKIIFIVFNQTIKISNQNISFKKNFTSISISTLFKKSSNLFEELYYLLRQSVKFSCFYSTQKKFDFVKVKYLLFLSWSWRFLLCNFFFWFRPKVLQLCYQWNKTI